jgi:lipoprotein-releasing system permease protein
VIGAELFIARRYLLAKRSIRFVNAISIVSAIGIAVGVAALLIALSVFNGFSGIVTSVLVSFDPHVRVEKSGGMQQEDIDHVRSLCAQQSGVIGLSPFISGKAMLVANAFNRVVYVRGVDPDSVGRSTGLREKMLFGDLSFVDSSGVPGIAIGLTLADRLAAVVGSTVTVISPYGLGSSLSGLSAPESFAFRVTGIFDSRNKDYDAGFAYIALPDAQRLFHMDGRYHGVEMRLENIDRSEGVKERLLERLPAGYSVSTWHDLHRSLYSVMNIERWAAYVLLSLIVLVASFNMLGSLTMGVLEKRRDIGVLQTMGMTRNGIVRIFLAEGMLIGVVGTLSGIVAGLVVLFLQIEYQLFPLDTTIYIIPAIPVDIRTSDFLLVSVSSLGLSFVASYLPARRAAALLPADVIRWE